MCKKRPLVSLLHEKKPAFHFICHTFILDGDQESQVGWGKGWLKLTRFGLILRGGNIIFN